MRQLTFYLENLRELERDCAQVRDQEEYFGSRILVLFVEAPGQEHLGEACRELICQQLDSAQVIGVSMQGDPLKREQQRSVVTVFLLERSAAQVLALDYDRHGAAELSQLLWQGISGAPDLRAALLFSSGASMPVERVLADLMEGRPDVPFFGVCAGLRREAGAEGFVSLTCAGQGGEQRLPHGLVLVLLCGEQLFAWAEVLQDWRAVGRQMQITSAAGSRTVTTVDHLPASTFYSRYLDLWPGDDLIGNTLEFPLLFSRGSGTVARVPVQVLPGGRLRFVADVAEGETFHLSFARPLELLRSSAQCAARMSLGLPQGLLLSGSLCRARAMGERAAQERQEFARICPQLCVLPGSAQLFALKGHGGVLQGALAVLGLREGVPDYGQRLAAGQEYRSRELIVSRTREGILPLQERMAALLDASTRELSEENERNFHRSMSDPLTQIANRRRLHIELVTRIADRGERPLSMLMVDIDHFKTFNDTYGHSIGDHVLRAVVERMSAALPEGSFPGRWGGEEFLVILPDTDLAAAAEIGERLRAAVEAMELEHLPRVTVSVGAALYESGESVHSFFNRADAAVYAAKRAGRNCLRTARARTPRAEKKGKI